MKYTLGITQACNLNCDYCYVNKHPSRMSYSTAERVVDLMYMLTPPGEQMNIGFFGGEPLLEFDLLKDITALIVLHPQYPHHEVLLDVVTNGTIFSDSIVMFLKQHSFTYCLSCDGPPEVQDVFRHFPDGSGSSHLVEASLKRARQLLPAVLVNAVYHPQTLQNLPQVVQYFSSLGLRQIYLNPDFTAPWTRQHATALAYVYQKIADLYIDYYLQGDPHYISLIDAKITVILRGGYQPDEKCQMGKKDFSFGPSGNIYLCERLIQDDSGGPHCIGNVTTGLDWDAARCKGNSQAINAECLTCGFLDYCSNWCGCTNYFSSGHYNRVGAFLCAAEKAAIQAAFYAFETLEKKLGNLFFEHLAGTPVVNSLVRPPAEKSGL